MYLNVTGRGPTTINTTQPPAREAPEKENPARRDEDEQSRRTISPPDLGGVRLPTFFPFVQKNNILYQKHIKRMKFASFEGRDMLVNVPF